MQSSLVISKLDILGINVSEFLEIFKLNGLTPTYTSVDIGFEVSEVLFEFFGDVEACVAVSSAGKIEITVREKDRSVFCNTILSEFHKVPKFLKGDWSE